jgi:hypothetical protein
VPEALPVGAVRLAGEDVADAPVAAASAMNSVCG